MRRGEECAPCRRRGHLCPAAMMGPRLEGDGDEPMCLACADGDPCVAERVAGHGREESGAGVTVDVYGEMRFAMDSPDAGRSRTPEELGLARVVPDVPVRKTLPLAWTDSGGVGPMRALRGEEEKAGMKANKLKEKVLAEPEASVDELVKKTGASKQQIYNWRYEVRKNAGLVAKPAQRAARKPQKQSALQRRIEVDPQRPGTAAALMTALDKVDANSERITIQLALTQAEIDHVLDRLGPEQRLAFLTAGLRAALLA